LSSLADRQKLPQLASLLRCPVGGETAGVPSTRVNDIELYYEVHGEGPPLLLIPGLGVDVTFFRALIDDLATSCRVVAFDPRGAGQSEKPDVPYSIDGMADDAVALLDHLGIERATVLGCSMGGRTALMLALDHRGRVDRLVLAASSAYVPPDRLFSRRWLIMDVLAQIPVPKRIDPQPRYAWRRQRQASVGFDVTSRLGEIDVPTLVIHGTEDHIVPFPLGRDVARRVSGARLVTVPGSHRALFVTHAGRLVEEVRTFVADSGS
jgi:pimeloyl-ACP methyl ester carboxylesterase